jgi:hypothetical protein
VIADGDRVFGIRAPSTRIFIAEQMRPAEPTNKLLYKIARQKILIEMHMHKLLCKITSL